MQRWKISLKRILLLIIILIFLSTVMSVVQIISYINTANSYKANLYNLKTDSMINSVNQNMHNYSAAMDTTALNPTIRNNIFRTDVDNSSMVKTGSNMRQIMQSTTYALTDDIYLDRYVFYTFLPEFGGYFLSFDTLYKQEWFNDYILFEENEENINKYFTFFEKNNLHKDADIAHRINIVKTINNFSLSQTSKNNEICYQVMTVNLKGVFKQDFDNNVDMSVHVFDSASGDIVYSDKTERDFEAKNIFMEVQNSNIKKVNSYENGSYNKRTNMPASVYLFEDINAYMVLMFEPLVNTMIMSNYEIAGMLFIVLVFIVLVVLLAVFYFNYSKRINAVVDYLDNTDDTAQPQKLMHTVGFDEIEQIEKHIVLMQNRIHQLIEEEYKLKLQKISAQYEALTACINPHFLYNTLNSISAMANIENAEDTGKMIIALRDMFQYTSDMSQKFVSLDMELKNISDYLSIQETRYCEKFRYYVDIADELLQCQVPKLTLQPLVENCFKHGFANNMGAGNAVKNEIIISASKENSVLEICVMDNGKGFDKEKLKIINDELNGTNIVEKAKDEIGIINVHRRLQILFGENFGLQIMPENNEYTCVKVKIYCGEVDLLV